MHLHNDSKTLEIVGGKTTPFVSCSIPDAHEAWVNVVVVYDGQSATCYGNGIFVATGTVVAPSDNSRDLGIGGWPNGLSDGHSMSGQYDEIRLRGGSLSADRIKADYDMIANRDFCTYGKVEVGR